MRNLVFNGLDEKIKKMKTSAESLEKRIIETAKFVEKSTGFQVKRNDLKLRATGKKFLTDIENLKFD